MKERSDYIFNHNSFYGIVGVAEETITPPATIYLGNWGAAKEQTALGFHLPLTLTALTFQNLNREAPLVIVSMDLGWWKNPMDALNFRNRMLEELSLRPEELMLCLSHTHAGPSICSGEVNKENGGDIVSFLNEVQDLAVRTVRNALLKGQPSTLTWSYGKCSLAKNRDLPEVHGKRILTGFNPSIIADDTLLVGRITDEENDIKAIVVNYACHPTTLGWKNRLISSDYVGAMRSLVEKEISAPCIFLQGASGELAPAQQYTDEVRLAEKNGRQLGYSVLSTLEGMIAPGNKLCFDSIMESGAPLAVWKEQAALKEVALSAQIVSVSYSLNKIKTAAEIETEYNRETDTVEKERLLRKLWIRKSLGDSDEATVNLWIWRLGSSFLVAQPNEAYSDFQIQLRQHLPTEAIAVMNLVNGSYGYLPPSALYEQDIYQVWQTPFAKGSLELLIETCKEVLEKKLSEN